MSNTTRGIRLFAPPGRVLLLVAFSLLLSILVTTFVPQTQPPMGEAAETSYYVAPDGDDLNPGTIDRPWRTLSKAALELQPGDTLLIRGGEYREQLLAARSGEPGAYITFKAYPGEQVVVRGNDATEQNGVFVPAKSYLVFEGLTVRGFHQGFNCQAPGHHIVISHNVFENNLSAGIASSGHASGTAKDCCDYLTIEDNTIRNNGYHLNGTPATSPGEGWGSGITLQPNSDPYLFDSNYNQFHTIIRRNTIYHNYDGTGGDVDNDPDHSEGHGIITDRGGDLPPLLIENNVIFDNGGVCIAPLGSQNVWIVGNTCYQNGSDPLFAPQDVQGEIVGFDTKVTAIKNLHVLNNIAYARAGKRITLFPDSDPYRLDMRSNVWFGSILQDSMSPFGDDYVFQDPRFVNPSIDPQVADFHLQASSPAIGAGTSMLPAGIQVDDHDGTVRPENGRYDAGAYEYAGVITSTLPGANPTSQGQ